MLRKAIFLTLALCAAAAGAAVVRDIPYAPENGKFGLGDLYLPESVSRETPVVLTIHGGGWTAGDRYSWSGVAEYFWRNLGCAVFNIEYRLASATNRWPACGNDCIQAANWLFSDDFRNRVGFSPKQIYICGGSAGGHLALWTALNLPPEKVAGAISISGIADAEPDRAAHPGRYRWMMDDGMPEMNPLSVIKTGGPRLLLTHAVGDNVVPVESERNFAAAYRAAGNIAEVFEYPCDVRPGLTGHCIWIPGSKPHRLIPEIESRIDAFVERGAGNLWSSFADPPDSVRPWCYWWWINGHADKETITADLEAMKRLGFGGVLMFDSRGYWDDEDHVVNPKPETGWGTDAWYDLVEFSIRECARLGLEFTMNASASGGTLNGFVDGREYETDIMDRAEVVAHLDRVVGPILNRVPALVGRTFTHIYSPSYEGNVKTGGSWKTIKDAFYATMRKWTHAHGLKLYSESGGPWGGCGRSTPLDCDQLDLLAHNDFPQGEFWVRFEKFTSTEAGHANSNGSFYSRAAVMSARREGRRIASLESFTHMLRHYSVDPSSLKPLADIAFADGANRLVWHTFTCSPRRFGVPGAEYFAGTHINRNVTWHKDAAAFVKYLSRCQALLQRGEPVDDGEFESVRTNYYGWGRFRKDKNAQFTMTHRREGNVDFFFVAGEGKGDVELNAAVNGRDVEIWDAVTCGRARCPHRAESNDKTRVSLDLPVGGSCFVVFWERGAGNGGRNSSTLELQLKTPTSVPVTNAWQVSFSYHNGISAAPPAPVVMDKLRDWTTFGEEGKADSASLRYFSGTAIYRTTFSQFHNSTCSLSLGELPTGLAHVFVNGIDCGVVWCAPWEVDVSSAIREGGNEIEIRYTNNWYNRLVGDCFLKPEDRVTRSTLRYWRQSCRGAGDGDRLHRRTHYSGPSADDPLQPSGLLGPVSLRIHAQEKKP